MNGTNTRMIRRSTYKQSMLSGSQKHLSWPKEKIYWNRSKHVHGTVGGKTSDSNIWTEQRSMSQVGRKLLALQGIKRKEDASHTIAIGKEMFGKIQQEFPVVRYEEILLPRYI